MTATVLPTGFESPDPADVLMVQAHFYHEPFYRLEHVCTRNGRTYAITVSAKRDPLAPVDATVWCYDGVEEVDVIRQDVGAVAIQRVVMTEVAVLSGMSGEASWYDEEEAHDVPV